MFNEDYLVQSDSYSKVMNETVVPWLKSIQRVTMLEGFAGFPLFCVSYPAQDPAGTVLIVHGFTENAFKYAELIYSLLHHHYSVIAYDQRGHGRSRKDLREPDFSVTHVDHFSDYIEDLRIVYDHYIPEMPTPHFVFAHSMGGAVTSLFLEQHPDAFSAAVLSSPMIAPNIGGVPAPIAGALCYGAKLLGRAKKHPFFMKPYSGPESFADSCSTDPDRFAWYDAVKASLRDFQNSVPSWNWSSESIKVTDRILADGAPEKISCPVILFSADQDSSVLSEPQKLFISRIPNGKQVFVRGSRHEIFRSANDVLFPWWHQVLSFYHDVSDSIRKV